MITYLDQLSETEQNLVVNAIPMITVLIAGADNNIDADEKEWAAKVTKYRAFTSKEILNDYYKVVGEVYSERLDEMMSSYPSNVEERTKLISDDLAKLNDILPKLDVVFAYRYYESIVSFAEHVAKASGGMLGFFTIGKEEAKLVDLPMVNKIERPAILEEEETEEETEEEGEEEEEETEEEEEETEEKSDDNE